MFWDNLVLLCNKKGVTPNGVCAELGLSVATATKWKKGAVPRDTTLKKVADYFGVTVDYLLGNEPQDKEPTPNVDPAEKFTPEEILLVMQFRSHPEARPFVRKLLDMPDPSQDTIGVVS